MTDLTTTIAPKSDQLNADDLIGKTKTIKITRVSLMAEPEQPVAINFEGDNGKPYKPCKSMRRVLVTVWGGDGNAYVGRSMTLFRDDDVRFGGLNVGGIRISHMSDITRETTLALTATRTVRKPYTVKPLASVATPAALDADAILCAAQVAAREGRVSFGSYWKGLDRAKRDALKPHLKALEAICDANDTPPHDPETGEITITTAPTSPTSADSAEPAQTTTPSAKAATEPFPGDDTPAEALMRDIREELDAGTRRLTVILNALGDRRPILSDENVKSLREYEKKVGAK